MSPNAPGSNEPNPASSTTAPPPREFDLLAFWIQYRRLVTRLVIIALLGLAGWGAYLFMEYRKRAGSNEAFVNAKTAVDFRKVTTDWPGTAAAGTATIRLADELRKEGKAAEAADALRDFLAKYPVHPLRVNAAFALAASLETAGKLDEALVAYQQFGASHGRSAFAPLAAIGHARVLIAQSKTDEAQKVLESSEQKFQGSPFVYEARQLLDEIKNAAGRKTGGSPRPTPAPAPALNLPGGTPAPLVPGVPPPAPGLKIDGAVPTPKAPDAPKTPPATPATPATPGTPATTPATPATTPPPAAPPAIPATTPASPAAPAAPATPATQPTAPATPSAPPAAAPAPPPTPPSAPDPAK